SSDVCASDLALIRVFGKERLEFLERVVRRHCARRNCEAEAESAHLMCRAGIPESLSARVGPVDPLAAEVRDSEAENPPDVDKSRGVPPFLEQGECPTRQLVQLVDVRVRDEPGPLECSSRPGERLSGRIARVTGAIGD